jgi:hypothetical protein
MKIAQKIRNYCGDCLNETNHMVRSVFQHDLDPWNNVVKYYCIVQCCGCDKFSYRSQREDFEMVYPNDQGDIEPKIKVETYPYYLDYRNQIEGGNFLPKKIKYIYTEAVKAMSIGCYLLAGVAFRTIIEAICIDKDVKGGNLKESIENLNLNHFITLSDCNLLHSIRFLGNDSVHDISPPHVNALYTVLDIVESLLRNLYLINREAKVTLETIVTNFHEFIELLEEIISKREIKDTITLVQLLGISIRRVKDVSVFESQLITDIKLGKYTKLALGALTKEKGKQQFVVVDNEFES